jgi:hypothetical protein
MINVSTNINQSLTYDELSKEFKELYRAAYRAFQLIPLMYNRLTLADKFSHSAALKKMYDDHKDLPGFSSRNIQRYLPVDNPNIPHRVMTRRHNSSNTHAESMVKLSNTKRSYGESVQSKETIDIAQVKPIKEIECPGCLDKLSKIQELNDALTKNSRFTKASLLVGTQHVYAIPKEKWYILTEAMEKSESAFFVIFDNDRNFVYADSDVERMNRGVSHDGK